MLVCAGSIVGIEKTEWSLADIVMRPFHKYCFLINGPFLDSDLVDFLLTPFNL